MSISRHAIVSCMCIITAALLAITLPIAASSARVSDATTGSGDSNGDDALTGLETRPSAWQLMPEASWKFARLATGQRPASMLIVKVGKPKTRPVRRLSTYAVLKAHTFSAATIQLRVKSLEPVKKKGRDVCIILGYVDDTHYTYVHLSNDADGRAHNIIMKVDGDTRRTIHEPKKPEPRLAADGWQHVRVRFGGTGRIEVYHVDMDAPLMTATDPDIVDKPIGIGSFNDRAAFSSIDIKRPTSAP